MNIYIPLEFPPWVFYYAITCYVLTGFYVIDLLYRSQMSFPWENRWTLALMHLIAPITVPVALIGVIVLIIIFELRSSS